MLKWALSAFALALDAAQVSKQLTHKIPTGKTALTLGFPKHLNLLIAQRVQFLGLQAVTAQYVGLDATEALYTAAAKYRFSPQAIIGQWMAAGVAYRPTLLC